MSHNENTKLMELAAELIDYYEGHAYAQKIEKLVQAGDLEELYETCQEANRLRLQLGFVEYGLKVCRDAIRRLNRRRIFVRSYSTETPFEYIHTEDSIHVVPLGSSIEKELMRRKTDYDRLNGYAGFDEYDPTF